MQFVIIGNGIAGISAAQMIRGLRPEAGITILTEEAHAGYSACVLPDYVSGEIERKDVFINEFSHYERDGIRLITGKGVDRLDADGKEAFTGDESLSYDRLIVATGSRAVVPPLKGLDNLGVFTLKSLDDADRIYKWKGHAAVVVGSGAVGVEAAVALRKRGYRVFLLELFDRIMPQAFDPYPSGLIRDILDRGGIKTFTGERVVEVLGEGRVRGVLTDRRDISCDTVIMAAGMSPDVRIARDVLALGGQGGIRVDEHMMTSIPDIYACGDCVEAGGRAGEEPGLSMLWNNAREQGMAAGCNAAGRPVVYPGSMRVSSVDLFGIQAVSMGRCSADVKGGAEVLEREAGDRYRRLVFAEGVLVGAQALNWSENMGSLLSAILRREKITSFADVGNWNRPLFRAPRVAFLGGRSPLFPVRNFRGG